MSRSPSEVSSSPSRPVVTHGSVPTGRAYPGGRPRPGTAWRSRRPSAAGTPRGTGRPRPYAATALDAFGPDRRMFGSGWPVCTLAATPYAQVLDTADELTAGLTPCERSRIFAGTAERAYGLTACPDRPTTSRRHTWRRDG
ncbi:amidohydrolase family protein [Streptomyces sp. NPDC099050]|uniref:amidohydrolase family protein n=1 Tax=Streptomyces sp. NPDC099050 TaxID=3366100 RepID=UPI00380492B2